MDFPYLLNMINGSFMSRPNTIVVPGAKMGFAMEVILTPLIHEMILNKKKAKYRRKLRLKRQVSQDTAPFLCLSFALKQSAAQHPPISENISEYPPALQKSCYL